MLFLKRRIYLMTKKLRHGLFALGVLITFIGFFTDRAESIPRILRLINPSYYHAKNGIKRFEQMQPLNKSDDGFVEISALVLNHYCDYVNKNRSTPLTKQEIEPLRVEWMKPNSTAVFNGVVPPQTIRIEFQITSTNNQVPMPNNYNPAAAWVMEPTLSEVQEGAEGLKNFKFSFLVFIFGIGLTVTTYLVENSIRPHQGQQTHAQPQSLERTVDS